MRLLFPTVLVLLACGCGRASSPSDPSPPARSAVVFTGVSPVSGSTIVVPEGYPYILPGGVVIPLHSGLISVGLSVTSAHEVPWAQLSVYLLTGDQRLEYCGQNDPDAPTWQFLTPGWTTTYTVTGFRIHRLPCEVTGIRAMLHMRNNGLLIPPMPTETIAEATLSANYRIVRGGSGQ